MPAVYTTPPEFNNTLLYITFKYGNGASANPQLWTSTMFWLWRTYQPQTAVHTIAMVVMNPSELNDEAILLN